MAGTPPSSAGAAHLRRGDRELAERSFRKALASDPKDASALIGLAKVFVLTGRRDDAIETCLTAASLCLEQGRAEKALEVCRRVSKLDPGRAGGHERLAEALHALGRTTEALEALRKAVDCHRRAKQIQDVVRVLRRVVELTPEGGRSRERIDLAAALAETGAVREALGEYREEARLLEAVGVLEVIGNRASLESGPAKNLLLTCLERIAALDPSDGDARSRLERYRRPDRDER